MARKKSEAEKAYQKELRRIKQFIRRAEKRGYQFKDNIIPKQPKRITKASVNRLKKLTPEVLYRKSIYGGSESYGEVIKGGIARKKENKTRARKAATTRQKIKTIKDKQQTHGDMTRISDDSSFFEGAVIQNFIRRISSLNSSAKNILYNWLQRLLASNSITDVAYMLEEGSNNGLLITGEVAYKSQALYTYMQQMMNYLPDIGSLFLEEMFDAIEEDIYNYGL